MAKRTETEKRILERFEWKKISAPRAWAPQVTGEELVGYYGGRTMRNGSFGQYEVVLVHVPVKGSLTISGIKIIQLLDAAMIRRGHPVRVIYKGHELLANGNTMRQFELFVAEGDPINEDELPQVQAGVYS